MSVRGLCRRTLANATITSNLPDVQGRMRIRHRAARVFSVAALTMIVFSFHARAQIQQGARRPQLEINSSDPNLVRAFNWARQQAMDYVNDGDPVGPWYEAALPGRRAFCMRDVSHQAAGAQALGLARYTHNMLYQFAKNISASKEWCSYWEINYLGRPAPVDYANDKEFWYNLPANFDVLDACYRMYLWTGDRSYIEDPVFLNFYKRTVTDYAAHWHLTPGQIMTRTTSPQVTQYFHGDPSYDESRRDIVLGIDMLATEYAGYRSFAAIDAIRGNLPQAQMYLQSASDVKSLINTRWWDSAGQYFYGYLDGDHRFQGHASASLLYRDVVDEGPKTQRSLDALLAKMRDEPQSEVEPESHYAEILYRYGRSGAAYEEIMDLARPGRARHEYPEVSYSVIGAIVNGLMGINVEPSVSLEALVHGAKFETVVSTMPRLTRQTAWAEVHNVPVAGELITVRHEGQRETIFSNHGTNGVEWEPEFPGSFSALLVNGKPVQAHSRILHGGLPVSWIRVWVPANGSARAEVAR